MVKRKQNTVSNSILICLLLISLIQGAFAVDNPDAPNLIGEFEKREMLYLMAIEKPKNSTRDFLIAYDNYLIFLNDELNKSFEIVMSKLPKARKEELIASQLHWKKYRDAEFQLIKNTWNRNDFGSSAGISRGDYKMTIVKDRVIQLLHYAKNF